MTPSTIQFDPLSQAFAADPYTVYRQMREAGEPFYFEGQNMWMLSRYDQVLAVATDPHMVRALEGIRPPEEIAEWQRRANWHDMPYHERVVQFSLLDSDGPVHRRLRKLIFGAFTNDSIAGLEPVVQGWVDHLLDNLEDRDTIDFIGDFAAHIPGYVIGQLLGAPAEDRVQLRLWSEQIVQFFDVDRSNERKQIAEKATRDFYHYLTALKAKRAAEPRDDLISKMLRDEAAGHYSQDEFISTCMLVLMAGHGSTIDVLGSGMHTLIRHPSTLESLKHDLSKLPVAIQEIFRYEPPLPFFHRHATKDVKVGGRFFPAGTTFGLLYGAANRDPVQFADPDLFDIERTPNRHLAFGGGAHLCLGNSLARLNMKVIFASLLQRFETIELVDEDVVYKRGLSVRGPKALPIRWRRAGG